MLLVCFRRCRAADTEVPDPEATAESPPGAKMDACGRRETTRRRTPPQPKTRTETNSRPSSRRRLRRGRIAAPPSTKRAIVEGSGTTRNGGWGRRDFILEPVHTKSVRTFPRARGSSVAATPRRRPFLRRLVAVLATQALRRSKRAAAVAPRHRTATGRRSHGSAAAAATAQIRAAFPPHHPVQTLCEQALEQFNQKYGRTIAVAQGEVTMSVLHREWRGTCIFNAEARRENERDAEGSVLILLCGTRHFLRASALKKRKAGHSLLSATLLF